MTTVRLLLAAALLTLAPWAAADDHSAAALESALDAASRPADDKARDAGRKPAQVLTFLGISDGDSVMDVMAAGGWYTEVLSIAVGDEGTVYAQNPPAMLQFRDGAYDKALTERLAGDRLPNVKRVDADFGALGIPPGSLDAAVTALNIHDVYHRNGMEAMVSVLQAIKAVLAPGGVVGVIDHVGMSGNDNASLHRIQKSKVVQAAQTAGFEMAGESDLLANPDDDHTQMVFAEGIRGQTDRFILKLKKPG